MASGCCGNGGCGCNVVGGTHIIVEGLGSSAAPFVISADFDFNVVDNDTFNLTISGTGTEDNPYALEVAFAATASVSDLPDWSDTVPSNGQVPTWNNGLGMWVPGSPTPAAAGSVSHDTSLTGDGSPGTPLAVLHDPTRFTATDNPDGIGLTDDGINNQVRRFANSAARTAAAPAPALNTVSVLDTAPGRYDRWTGSAWVPMEALPVVSGAALLELSGAYTGGRVVQLIKQIAGATDVNGDQTILSGADFTGSFGTAAGVLSCVVQPTGTVRFDPLVSAPPGAVQMTAYQGGSSAVLALQPITATVVATFYV